MISPRLLGAAAVVLAVADAGAQQASLSPAAAPRQVLSSNVLGIPFGYYNVEFERAVGPNTSVGVSGSYFTFLTGADGIGDPTYAAADVRVRLYPTAVLNGFAVGLSGGWIGAGTSGVDVGGATVGTTLEYQWLLGARRQFAFELGGGFKRILLIDGRTPAFTTFYPTVRTSIGVAF